MNTLDHLMSELEEVASELYDEGFDWAGIMIEEVAYQLDYGRIDEYEAARMLGLLARALVSYGASSEIISRIHELIDSMTTNIYIIA